MTLSATEVRVLSRLLERALAQPAASREAWLQALPEAQQMLVPRLRERLVQLALPALGSAADASPPLAAAKPPPRAEERVGPYRLLQALGAPLAHPPGPPPVAGDTPQMWKAERADGSSRHALALWLLPAAAVAERQVVMLPAHPQTLRLQDVGSDEQGRSYRVMPFVEGVGLLDHVRHRGLRLPQRLKLLQQVAQRVAQAHADDVALGALGLAQWRVDDEGRLLLLDWGLGRMLRADTVAANVQALGTVLQALLCGAAPGPDLATVLQRAQRAGTPKGYGSVEALLDDLAQVLAFRPVPGAPGGTWHQTRLALRRERVPLAMASLLVLALVAAALFAWQHFQRGQGQAQRADEVQAFLQQALHEDASASVPVATDLAVMAPRLQRALEQARAGFAGEPVLRGQVITALGVRFRELGQPEQAQAVLREALALLMGTAAAGDPALHAAQAQLAWQLVQPGAPAAAAGEAAALARSALLGCTQTGPVCEAVQALARRVEPGAP